MFTYYFALLKKKKEKKKIRKFFFNYMVKPVTFDIHLIFLLFFLGTRQETKDSNH